MTDYRDISNPNDTVRNRSLYAGNTPSSGRTVLWVIIAAAVLAFGALFFLSPGPASVDPNTTTSSVTNETPAGDDAGTLALPANPSVEPAPATPPAPASTGQ